MSTANKPKPALIQIRIGKNLWSEVDCDRAEYLQSTYPDTYTFRELHDWNTAFEAGRESMELSLQVAHEA